MPAVPSPPDASPRLPYSPSLDGVRALAVVAVLLFHSNFRWARGGFLGVSLFFTLSGFLITSLVVAEHQASGRVSLRNFWARRLRRLMPASLLTLAGALVVTAIAVPHGQQVEAIGDIRAALFDVANWRFVALGVPYADLVRVPSPVQHYWSLAVEEQFYLVFPVIAAVALRYRRRALAVVFFAATGISLACQLAIHDPVRVYYGTDTRMAEIAVGGLLALWCASGAGLPDRFRTSWLADVAGWTGLAATVVLWLRLDKDTPNLYRGAFVGIAVISALVVFGAVHGRSLTAVLAWRPFVALGRSSYGVYLFHFPLYLLMSPARTGLDGVALFAARAAVTVSAASLSSWALERPVRERRGFQARMAVPGLALVVAVVALAPHAVVTRVDEVVAAHHSEAAAAAGPGATSGADPTTTTGPAAPTTTPGGPPATAAPGPAAPLPPAPRVVIVGDSTAHANGDGLKAWGDANGRLDVLDVVWGNGCTALTGKAALVRDGYIAKPKDCDTLFDRAADSVATNQPDAVLVFIGSSQLLDWRFGADPTWHNILEPPFDAQYVVALRTAVEKLAAGGVPILWADLPIPAWDLDKFGEELGSPLPGSGPVTMNSPPRTAELNELTVVTFTPETNVVIWPYAEHLSNPDGSVDPSLRPDGLHLSMDGVATIADAWLYQDLHASYLDALQMFPTTLSAARATAWSAPS